MPRTLALLVSAALAAPALAQHTGDIALSIHEGRIETGAFEGGSSTIGERVFLATLGAQGFPDFTDSPGFDCFSGTFPTGSSVAFTITDALRFWNGNDFSTIPDATISIEFLTLGPITTPSVAGQSVAGFSLPVSASGQWHRHLDYYLDPPAEDGVYLLTMTLRSTHASIDESEPFHILFSRNASAEDIDSASAFLEPAGCPADLTTTGSSNGLPDGVVNGSDFTFFLSLFAAADPAVDLTTTGTTNGTPDGQINGSDFTYYLSLFAAGCP